VVVHRAVAYVAGHGTGGAGLSVHAVLDLEVIDALHQGNDLHLPHLLQFEPLERRDGVVARLADAAVDAGDRVGAVTARRDEVDVYLVLADRRRGRGGLEVTERNDGDAAFRVLVGSDHSRCHAAPDLDFTLGAAGLVVKHILFRGIGGEEGVGIGTANDEHVAALLEIGGGKYGGAGRGKAAGRRVAGHVGAVD